MLLAIGNAPTFAGVMLSWGPTSDLPNGVLGLTSLAVNGAEVRFANPGGQGFDVGFSLSRSDNLGSGTGYFGSSDELTLPNPAAPAGGNYIYFNPDTASTRTIYFHIRFYATGTNDPVDVVGLKTQLEDVERGATTTREWIYSPKITSGGVSQILDFNNTSIFNLPAGTLGTAIENVTVAGESMQRAVPGHNIASGTQAGKTLGIDLTDTPLSYFRIGTSRTSGSAGSWLMGTLGEIELAQAAVPEPAAWAAWSVLLALTGIANVTRRRPQP